jgi:hypothetical protein
MSIRDVTRLIDDFAYRHKTTGVMWARGQEGGNSTWPEQRKAILDSIDALQTNAYAEGRKDEREQWEPVARLVLAALNTCDGCDGYKGYSQWFGQEQVENAIKALCALICPVCLGAGWVAERPGEQCLCGLHSWEARK